MKKLFLASILTLASFACSAQLIYGNTFPFWTVTGLTTTNTLTVNSTSTLTGVATFTAAPVFSAGIAGASGSATAGAVGEIIASTIAVADTIAGAATGTSKNITSISLTAGDWDVSGVCDYVLTGATISIEQCGLGLTTNTLIGTPASGIVSADSLDINTSTVGTTLTGSTSQLVPVTRVLATTAVTLYLVANLAYSAGSFTQHGTLRARRMR